MSPGLITISDMKALELIGLLKGIPETAEMYGQFSLKHAQAVLLPLGGIRPAKTIEKQMIEIPPEKLVWTVYAKGEELGT